MATDQDPRWVLVVLGLLICAGTAWAGLMLARLPDGSALVDGYPVVRYAEDGSRVVEIARDRPKHWVDLGALSEPVIGAFLVNEDRAFYVHRGIDWVEVRESIKANVKTLSYKRGASTITQQVARNVQLGREKTMWRKVKEVVIARRMEEILGKERILEIYLNLAEMAPELHGIDPAARYFFGKPGVDLGIEEAAFISILLPSPFRYSQSFRERKLTEFARTSVDRTLLRLRNADFIDEQTTGRLLGRPLSFEDPVTTPRNPESREPADGTRE